MFHWSHRWPERTSLLRCGVQFFTAWPPYDVFWRDPLDGLPNDDTKTKNGENDEKKISIRSLKK